MPTEAQEHVDRWCPILARHVVLPLACDVQPGAPVCDVQPGAPVCDVQPGAPVCDVQPGAPVCRCSHTVLAQAQARSTLYP
jgi:hypothetical protein